MPKAVERAIRKVARKVTPRAGETRKQASIKILKANKTIKQRGKHLVKVPKKRRT